jgi:hypothetical protein
LQNTSSLSFQKPTCKMKVRQAWQMLLSELNCSPVIPWPPISDEPNSGQKWNNSPST